MNWDVIIVGAGLAGLTCGLELSLKGNKVLVLEANPVVGGRCSNWNDAGMEVESGFHRYIGYFSALPALLKKAGVDINDILTWEEKIDVLIKGKKKKLVLGISPVHGVLKMIRGITGNQDVLTIKDKLSLIPFSLNGYKDFLLNPKKLDQYSVKEYAGLHNVTDNAFDYLLVPLSSGSYFLPADRYSAYVFFGLFAPAFYKFYKMRIGAFSGGMTDVMCQPIADQIIELGGAVQIGEKVTDVILNEKGEVAGVKGENRKEYRSKQVVVAASLAGAKQVLARFKEKAEFSNLFRLPINPASTFQIDLNQPALETDITSFGPKTALASFAEQSRTTFRDCKGRLSIILDSPDKFLSTTAEDALKIVIEDAKALGVHLEGKIEDYRKIDHPEDIYSLAPGNHFLRPGQATTIPGLTLAGDYTKQPYFSTMEGAVVSGQKAAAIVTKALQRKAKAPG
ncbi:FAD-dependent oxidoreductase [Sediminibacillus albus]|uniref:15-cis-phytoene desaturase n=1 Tax=Sediminibacillus albus TaxID=407036 RepID=A0A1G8Z0X4_9BACI|nr:FAD-dependent oxidoreductase [Sediminibacillus albus]SDK08696.1 15-cis-phytoene desaturase [Sediminibacillus albus]